MEIQKLLLIPNPNRPHALHICGELARLLRTRGCQPLMDRRYEEKVPDAVHGPFEQALCDCDAVVTVGGDGTLLHGAKHAVEFDKPLIGINAGRLGYLARLEPDQLNLVAELTDPEAWTAGQFWIESRMMLEVQVAGTAIHYALNDVVVTGRAARLVDLQVCADGAPLGDYRADGLIFATPVGSTAYSLSAGGPIVDPRLEVILLTPVCPHALGARPVLLSPSTTLTISSRRINNPDMLEITADGERVAQVDGPCTVEVRKAQKAVRLICLGDQGFYHILNQKMKAHI